MSVRCVCVCVQALYALCRRTMSGWVFAVFVMHMHKLCVVSFCITMLARKVVAHTMHKMLVLEGVVPVLLCLRQELQ